VLRGIYLLTQAEDGRYYSVRRVGNSFRTRWERFLAPIPEAERGT